MSSGTYNAGKIWEVVNDELNEIAAGSGVHFRVTVTQKAISYWAGDARMYENAKTHLKAKLFLQRERDLALSCPKESAVALWLARRVSVAVWKRWLFARDNSIPESETFAEFLDRYQGWEVGERALAKRDCQLGSMFFHLMGEKKAHSVSDHETSNPILDQRKPFESEKRKLASRKLHEGTGVGLQMCEDFIDVLMDAVREEVSGRPLDGN